MDNNSWTEPCHHDTEELALNRLYFVTGMILLNLVVLLFDDDDYDY